MSLVPYRHLGWLSALLAALLAAPTRASADAPSAQRMASLAWVRSPGAESCMGPRALTAAVEQKLGRQAITAPARADLMIEGRAERSGGSGAWYVTIARVGEAGEVLGLRELATEAQDCRTLDDEIALVIALLIDPGAALPKGPPAPEAPRTPPASAPPPPPGVAPPACPPPPPSPPPVSWRFGVQAGAVGGLGLLPGAALGVAARARVTPPGWPSLELGGAFFLQRDAGPVGAGLSLAWGSLAVCPFEPEKEGNRFRLCAGAVVGSLRAESLGLEAPRVLEQVVVDPDAEVRYERRIAGPVVISAGFGLLVPTVRHQFYYVNAMGMRRDVFRLAPVAGTGEVTAGIELR